MTALAGLWRGGGPTRADVGRMLAAQAMYGPLPPRLGGEAVTLGVALHPVLAAPSPEPMPVANATGTRLLVGDIRLDNRRDVARDLECEPMGDASLALAAIERWGPEGVERLVGDFALAWWDAKAGSLHLARDFAGQRPLHYHQGKDFFAFASMPRGLHALPEIPLAADEERAAEFLALLPHVGAASFFVGIERVRPGHVVTFDGAGVSTDLYWRPERTLLNLPTSEAYREAFRAIFDPAVAARIEDSQVLIGSELSGGLDSSTVTATAAVLLAREGRRLSAFTAVPRGAAWAPTGSFADEGSHAAAVAALHANIDHHPVTGGDRSPLARLDRYFFLLQQPLPNLCNGAWASAIQDEAQRRGVTVMLTGTMGNIGFSYDGVIGLAELMRSGRVLRWGREAWALAAARTMRWPSIAAQSIGPFLPPRLWSGLRKALGKSGYEPSRYSALSQARFDSLDVAGRAAARGVDVHFRPWGDAFAARLSNLSQYDPGCYNKGVLAGWNIDLRDPTADRRLIEYCLLLPLEQFLHRGQTRRLARTAMADRLPALVLEERRKGYQGADWHRGLLAEPELLDREVKGMLDFTAAGETLDVARLWSSANAARTAAASGEEWEERYRFAMLRGFSVSHFLRRAAGSNQ